MDIDDKFWTTVAEKIGNKRLYTARKVDRGDLHVAFGYLTFDSKVDPDVMDRIAMLVETLKTCFSSYEIKEKTNERRPFENYNYNSMVNAIRIEFPDIPIKVIERAARGCVFWAYAR